MTGETLHGQKNDYILLDRKGSKGKYGGVWVGTTADGNQKVTVKCMSKYGPSLPSLMQRLAGIDSPYVAKVLDTFVADDGCLYIVRQYVEGTDLKTLFTSKSQYRKIDERKFIDAGKSVLKALIQTHEAGIVHRDVKPSNVIIQHLPGQNPVEADFAQAVLIDFEQCSPYPDTSGVRSSFALVYSPPEMLLKYNSLVGPWSDLFALSVMLFQLIMGKAPYTDCNPEILVNLQLTYPMKQPVRMADDLFGVLSHAAYKHPFRLPPRRLSPDEIEQTLRQGVEGRYQSAADMLADLEKVGEPFKKTSWINRIFNG